MSKSITNKRNLYGVSLFHTIDDICSECDDNIVYNTCNKCGNGVCNSIECHSSFKVKYLLKDQGMTIIGVKKVLNSDKSLKLDELPNNSINANYSIKNKLKNISELIKKIKSLK